jgi:sterol 3beta-glucosyltransferase
MAPTREYPSLIFYDSLRLGQSFNQATHKIFEQIMWSASSSAVKQFWKQEYGRLPENFSSPFSKQTTRTRPTIISCSDYIFPRPADWSEHVHNTGYWFLDEDETWDPPAGLMEFLQRGKPPVYVGFGSLSDPASAEKTTRLVIGSLRQSGQRGVLATGWNGMTRLDDAPEDIFILENAPHSWLFPRMAAVVHHGGAGTTAAGLRAGVPGIIIPHSNDQFAWGRRVYELGVGAKPIPRKKLTQEILSRAVDLALTPEINTAAAALGRKIQCENSAERAAQIILDTLAPEKI